MMVRGDPVAPIKHLYLSEPSADRDLDNHTLQKIADKVHTLLYSKSCLKWQLKKKTKNCFSRLIIA